MGAFLFHSQFCSALPRGVGCPHPAIAFLKLPRYKAHVDEIQILCCFQPEPTNEGTVGGGSFFFQNHGLETLISTVIEALQITKGKMEQRKIYAEKNHVGRIEFI